MARRSDHSREEIKEMVLNSVESIVTAQGYKALSARKIAAEIGYTVGTLYLVFQNLDDITLHVNGRTLDKIHDLFSSVSQNYDTPESIILALGKTYIDFAKENPGLWGMVYEHVMPEGETVPDWYHDKIVHIFEIVESALQPYQRSHSKDDIKLAARVIWSGVHGICILSMTRKLNLVGNDSDCQMLEVLIGHFLTGFKAQTP